MIISTPFPLRNFQVDDVMTLRDEYVNQIITVGTEIVLVDQQGNFKIANVYARDELHNIWLMKVVK